MTDEELNAIEARCKAATPGPWLGDSGRDIVVRDGGDWVSVFDYKAPNAEFIAHARADLPGLLAEVRRLQRLLAKYQVYADTGEWPSD